MLAFPLRVSGSSLNVDLNLVTYRWGHHLSSPSPERDGRKQGEPQSMRHTFLLPKVQSNTYNRKSTPLQSKINCIHLYKKISSTYSCCIYTYTIPLLHELRQDSEKYDVKPTCKSPVAFPTSAACPFQLVGMTILVLVVRTSLSGCLFLWMLFYHVQSWIPSGWNILHKGLLLLSLFNLFSL